MTDAMIRFEDVSFSYPSKEILKDLNFSVPKGKTIGLVGESGSGKTTTLRLMNGLLKPTKGKVFIEGKEFDFAHAEKWRRKMGYSIQGSGLFPHMNIEKNITLIARKEKWSREKMDARLEELCNLVNLPYDPIFLRKLPRQISGGQQQRVGIARALFMKPNILLMDEPFGALDPITREEVQNEFIDLVEKLQLTIVLVTHDLTEAFRMCDKIILLQEGRVAQMARPSEFLLRPANDYVERFIQTNSPGHLLKQVKLYSVVNGEVLTTQKLDSGFRVNDLDKETQQIVGTHDELVQQHQQRQQQFVYWVDQNGHLDSFQEIQGDSLGEPYREPLKTRDDILYGMRKIMTNELPLYPVINNKKEMIGVFSKGALDAL